MESLFYLREYLFPQGCGVCGKALFTAHEANFGLCGSCMDFFTSALDQETRCGICGKPLISEKGTCLSCRERAGFNGGTYNEQLVRLYTLYPYMGKFRALLGAYKFKKSIAVGNFLVYSLGLAMKELLARPEWARIQDEAVWVPVPPRPGKLKKQGWDQIEFLAKLMERDRGGLALRRCLKRLHSRTQKELNREDRGKNLTGRIICTRPPPKTAILLDDVITTGSTLNACAQALLEGGAERVFGVCLFFD